MNIYRFDRERATILALALIAALCFIAAYFLSSAAHSQQIEIGPGGIAVNPLPNYGRTRSWGRTCEELRLACEYKMERGEEGMGNCRRYRQTCQY